MPAETRNYVINIARFYQQYGGKGDYFSNIKSIGQMEKRPKQKALTIQTVPKLKICKKLKMSALV